MRKGEGIGVRAIAIVLGMLALVVVLSAAAMRNGVRLSTGDSTAPDALEASRILVNRPALPSRDAANANVALRLSGARLLQRASAVQARIPRPSGVAPFDWSTWGGGISPEGVERIESLRAACAWISAYASGTDAAANATQRAVIADIPKWPAFRTTPIGDKLQAVSRAVAAGHTSDAVEPIRPLC
jgi:hypothetical protein